MNDTQTMSFSSICYPERPEGLLSFLVSRSRSAQRSLAPSASEVIRGCAEAVQQIVHAAIETRTKTEFHRLFDELFPKYASLSLAISSYVSAVIQKPVIEQLVRESICEMEADFRDKGLESFGALVRDQAIFTVWTLRKINELTSQIIAVPLSPTKRVEDQEYCSQFNLNALRAHFCLECLNAALGNEQAIYPEVLDELIDGLRSMVNAYTWARRGLEIRVPSETPTLEFQDAFVDPNEDAALMDLSFSEASEWLERERGMDATG